jgi:hypothetical protein
MPKRYDDKLLDFATTMLEHECRTCGTRHPTNAFDLGRDRRGATVTIRVECGQCGDSYHETTAFPREPFVLRADRYVRASVASFVLSIRRASRRISKTLRQ